VITRYRAVLAYDGTDYLGFQRQPGNVPTIQKTVEAAIERVTQQTVTVNGAGRTDSGVHASGQVIAFDVDWRHPPHELWRALNAKLPGSIVLKSLDEAEPRFHPRFDAQSRAYEYTLYVAPVRNPLLIRYAWHVSDRRLLDTTLMQIAAAKLVGEHDFATFGMPPHGENTVRLVYRSEFSTIGEFIRYHIRANAFLYRMVRRIVGTLIRVGDGTLTLDAFEDAFRAADVTRINYTAPACGLCLTEVNY
jgi:tRNA pseudouridine38-40 synthase